jgi:hypothetical protein
LPGVNIGFLGNILIHYYERHETRIHAGGSERGKNCK